MFSTLRKFFGARADNAVDSSRQLHSSGTAQVLPANPQRAVRLEAAARQAAPPANTPSTLAIPLRSVLDRLPPELAMRVRQLEVGDTHISIPMQKVLSQISQGAVKITYWELRQAAPPGTFTSENDRDRNLVEIPLHEVLARLNPALLSRRSVQKQVCVPAEVTGPFSGQAQVMFTTAPLKAAVPMQPVPRNQSPVPPPAAPVAPTASPVPATPLSAMRPVPPLQPYSQPASAPRAQAPAPYAYPQHPQPAQTAPTGTSLISRIQPVPSAPAPAPAQYAPSPVQYAPAPIAPVPPAPVQYAPPPLPLPPVARVRTKTDTEQVFFRTAVPMAPPPPSQPVYSPILPEPTPEPIAQAPYIPVPEIPVAYAPVAPITPIAPEPEPEPAPIRFSTPPPPMMSISAPAPIPAPAPAAEPVPAPPPAQPAETRFLNVALADVSANWPAPVLQEVEQFQLGNSFIALPFGMIDVAIRQGKVALQWRVVRPWIQPPVLTNASPFDGLEVELPLRILTPLFLAELRVGKPQKRVQVDENIPDLFSNNSLAAKPAPAPLPANIPKVVVAAAPANAPRPVPPPVGKLADTNYFGRSGGESPTEEAPPAIKKGQSPGTAFLVRYATPNEIVSKTAALDGVDGALIALPDGLLVASHIPSTMNADTVAAFLPQIFGRVSQCTKELRLGDLNNLNFTVGNIPWKIFKVGAIYFAAFGRAGEPLPTAQLAGIAAELDRKAK